MKTAIITGIGKGIGKALSERYLAEGYRVFGTSMTGAADISHDALTVLPLDLRSRESITSCVSALKSEGVSIDVLVNNAGVLLDEEKTELDPSLLRETLEVNLIGPADFTERLIPLFAKDAHILFVTSTAGSLERTGHLESHYPGHYPAYKISKAALNMYGRTLALRLTEAGITVSLVHPGWVRTDMGGKDADLSPEEAAENICAFSATRPQTGCFWFKGEPLPW